MVGWLVVSPRKLVEIARKNWTSLDIIFAKHRAKSMQTLFFVDNDAAIPPSTIKSHQPWAAAAITAICKAYYQQSTYHLLPISHLKMHTMGPLFLLHQLRLLPSAFNPSSKSAIFTWCIKEMCWDVSSISIPAMRHHLASLGNASSCWNTWCIPQPITMLSMTPQTQIGTIGVNRGTLLAV